MNEPNHRLNRREFTCASIAATLACNVVHADDSKKAKTFTILHTNDIHSNLIGVGPASEYTPAALGDDKTIGGIERIASLIASRKKARSWSYPLKLVHEK